MATRASLVSYGALDQVDTAKRHPLGTYIHVGNESYVYVQGVTNGAVGSWAHFTGVGVTTLIAGNGIGLVCIFMAALDATTKYGFAMVRGVHTAAKTDTTAANLPLFIDGTAGRADDVVVSGDLIANAFSVTADTTNVCTVFINHPYTTDTLS